MFLFIKHGREIEQVSSFNDSFTLSQLSPKGRTAAECSNKYVY